jgi:A/G-specific adenine glycosylase
LLSKSDKILAWYDQNRRLLPWRSAPGVLANPYHVWLSEIMLQQTTVVTVKPYFEYFLAIWPNIKVLAIASLDDVLHAWQGLGYYARARNLHKCADIIASDYNGFFPEDEKNLLELPGIGPYTAAAITAIAFGKKATPVDGNIERVVARLFSVIEPIPKSKIKLHKLACAMTPDERAGDYAQALMDIGATICMPKKPMCSLCPLSGECKAEAKGIAGNLPNRVPKKKKPTRVGTIFWLSNDKGEILLRRRPEKGLLGGMVELPSSDWREDGLTKKTFFNDASAKIDWEILPGRVRHTFTHFHLELEVAAGQCIKSEPIEGIWSNASDFGNYALPTVMKKVAAHALKYGSQPQRL